MKPFISGPFIFFACIIRNTVWSQQINIQVIEVNTGFGVIQGYTQDSVSKYLGVPYAQPAGGSNRFKPPIPMTSLNEPYQAFQHKPACMQNRANLESILTEATGRTTDEVLTFNELGMNEDCLYLDIYAPAPLEGLPTLIPVMVFIHGGDFTSGTGAVFNGERLAFSQEVLVVALNYRLGVFGFLFGGNDDISGNFGILDQRMALKWIKENIQEFGGDPDAITIFGEEAGGSSAHIHLLGADSNSFKNVIIQSAQYDDGVLSERQCTDQYNNFLSALGYDWTSDVNELLSTQSADLLQLVSESVGTWRPCNLSNILNDFPSVLMKQEDFSSSSNISVLCGTNSGVGQEREFDVTDDAWLFNVTEDIVTTSFPQLYENINSGTIGFMSENYFQFYAGYDFDDSDAIQRSSFSFNTFGDQYYKTWAEEISRTTSKLNMDTYKYMFTGQAIDGSAGLSTELPYIFGFQPNPVINAALVETMMAYWINFAKTGNPNPMDAIDSWPLYNANSIDDSSCRNIIELNAIQTIISSDSTALRTWDFWTVYYELLDLSCIKNDTNLLAPNEEECEPSVQDAIGMAVSNEDAAIMLIVFIVLTGVFLIASLITSFCCWRYKKKFQRQKKKNKKERGHDNHSSSAECKF